MRAEVDDRCQARPQRVDQPGALAEVNMGVDETGEQCLRRLRRGFCGRADRRDRRIEFDVDGLSRATVSDEVDIAKNRHGDTVRPITAQGLAHRA